MLCDTLLSHYVAQPDKPAWLTTNVSSIVIFRDSLSQNDLYVASLTEVDFSRILCPLRRSYVPQDGFNIFEFTITCLCSRPQRYSGCEMIGMMAFGSHDSFHHTEELPP
jgi:hypothetical protein